MVSETARAPTQSAEARRVDEQLASQLDAEATPPKSQRQQVPASDADVPIATIRKNSREAMHVQLRTFKGYRSVDLRIFVLNGEGQPAPTAKGVSIRPAMLRDVIEALQAAERQAVAEGLISPDGGANG
jgi:hypothetical protein